MVGGSVKWIIPRLSSRLPDEMGRKAPAGVPSTPRKWFPPALSRAVCRATSTKIYELKLELNVQLSDSAPCRPYRWVKFGLYREADGSLPAAAPLLAPTSPEKKQKKLMHCGKKKRNHTPGEALTTVYTVAACKHSLEEEKKNGAFPAMMKLLSRDHRRRSDGSTR